MVAARKKVVVIGSGISGLSAAWLLARGQDVTLVEADQRIGGHSNTVDVATADGIVPVDTGFIVYNAASYPNLVALFQHLDVPTVATAMGFAVSLDGGRYEYSGSGLGGLFGQPSNLAKPAHWRLIADMLRFFRSARILAASTSADDALSLGRYLEREGYSPAFISRHILPMAAAIWSTPARDILEFPVSAFVRFFENHGLLQVRDRPAWRTVVGGSRQYVRRILDDMPGRVEMRRKVRALSRHARGVDIVDAHGARETFDACVVATHADDALALLADPDDDEQRWLGAFRYQSNRAVLHRDARHMPSRRRLWSSWNYLSRGEADAAALSVTYWMNALQPIGRAADDVFVTLNPVEPIAQGATIAEFAYAHPMFDATAMRAQRELWRLQGRRHTWFCGSYFGYGFHEDGLQAGLWAAEDLGGVERPWRVAGQSARIHLPPVGRTVGALAEAVA